MLTMRRGLPRLILSKEILANMYIDENDNRTPRERIDDSFLRRMLGENGGVHSTPTAPRGGREQSGQGGLSCNPGGASVENYRLMNFPLGMVYSPIQEWRNAYDVDMALERGTLFRELDMPWEVAMPSSGKGGRCCD